MGASASPMTGATRRSDSCSSTYQSARPSHQAVEAKTPSSPTPANRHGATSSALGSTPRIHRAPGGGRADDLPQGFADSGSRPTSRIRGAARTRPAALRPPRHEPVDCSSAGRSRGVEAVDPDGDRRRREDLAFIEASGLAHAGAVCRQPVEHDVEKQSQPLPPAKCCDLAHGIFGRSGNAQPWVRRVRSETRNGSPPAGSKIGPGRYGRNPMQQPA